MQLTPQLMRQSSTRHVIDSFRIFEKPFFISVQKTAKEMRNELSLTRLFAFCPLPNDWQLLAVFASSADF